MEYLNVNVTPDPAVYPDGQYTWMRLLVGDPGSSMNGLTMTGPLNMNGNPIQNASALGADLGDLSDVTIAAPVNGQVLTYNAGIWDNQAVPAASLALDDLTDVTIAAPVNGQVLTYNAGVWDNQAVPAGATQLNDLSDVTISAPSANDALIRDGVDFKNEKTFIRNNSAKGTSRAFALGAALVPADGECTFLTGGVLDYDFGGGAQDELRIAKNNALGVASDLVDLYLQQNSAKRTFVCTLADASAAKKYFFFQRSGAAVDGGTYWSLPISAPSPGSGVALAGEYHVIQFTGVGREKFEELDDVNANVTLGGYLYYDTGASDFTSRGAPISALCHQTANATLTATTVTNSWVKCAGTTVFDALGGASWISGAANNRIELTGTSPYTHFRVHADFSYLGDTGADTYELGISRNGAAPTKLRTVTSSLTEDRAGSCCDIQAGFNPGDWVELQARNITGTNQILLKDFQLTLVPAL